MSDLMSDVMSDLMQDVGLLVRMSVRMSDVCRIDVGRFCAQLAFRLLMSGVGWVWDGSQHPFAGCFARK